MPIPTILLADNDPDFLSICTEFLESAGYQVLKASSPEDVKTVLATNHVHLAIFDLRLTNDDNEKDRSGLMLAKEVARSIPKLILTKFPSHEDVRDAMKLDRETFPPAVDFIDKRKGLESLLNSIHQVFSDHVRINWNLSIDWKAREAFGLVKLIEAGLKNEAVLQRAEEFQDLLSRLFYDKEFIRLDRILWQTDNRIAIVIFAFKDGQKPDATLVVCGQNIMLNEESLRFEAYAPKEPNKTSTLLAKRAETVHFAANSYILKDNDLERVRTLDELYRTGPEKTFNSAISTLFQDTLQSWHQEKPVHPKNKSIESLYRERLHITTDLLESGQIDKRFEFVAHQALTLGVVVKRLENSIRFNYNERLFTFSNPISILDRDFFTPGLVINAPGSLTGENIIVDDIGRTWLTNFIDAGQTSLLWNYVSLESSIRYDWIDAANTFRRFEMENCLINTEFAKPDIRDLDLIIRKPVRAIQSIRKLAVHHMGTDTYIYNQGVFLQGLSRFLSFDTQSPLKSSELVRLVHILISMSMIASVLTQGKEVPNEFGEQDYPELHIDIATQVVFVGEQRRRLSPRPYKLLQYLYENSNKVCTMDELRKNVIGENYNTTYIHTLVGRIREAIEKEPEHPHYLISEPNVGYRLILNPLDTIK